MGVIEQLWGPPATNMIERHKFAPVISHHRELKVLEKMNPVTSTYFVQWWNSFKVYIRFA